MKKPPLRIIVPAISAIVLSMLILGLVWWQLQREADRARLRLQGDTIGVPTFGGDDAGSTFADTGDTVLLHLRQGDLNALQGDWALAEKEYQASVEAGGGVPALRKLAEAQLQRRNIPAVQKTIEQLTAEGARGEDILLLKAIVLLRTGELVQAETLLKNAADSPQQHYGLALLAIVQNDHVAARHELQQVLAGWDPTLRAYARTIQSAYDEYGQFPNSPQSHLITLLSRALAQVQECELALPLLAQVLHEHDDYRDAWIVQGYCEFTTERTKEALSSFEQAYNIDPEKPEIQYFLGRTYLVLQDYKNAITYLQYAIQNGFTPAAEAHKRLAQAAAESGDTGAAINQYRALAEDPGSDVSAYEKLVTLGISLNQKENAYSDAQSAVQRWPDEAKAHEMLGWAAAETNRKDEARAELQKAIELDPNLQSAKDKLGKL